MHNRVRTPGFVSAKNQFEDSIKRKLKDAVQEDINNRLLHQKRFSKLHLLLESKKEIEAKPYGADVFKFVCLNLIPDLLNEQEREVILFLFDDFDFDRNIFPLSGSDYHDLEKLDQEMQRSITKIVIAAKTNDLIHFINAVKNSKDLRLYKAINLAFKEKSLFINAYIFTHYDNYITFSQKENLLNEILRDNSYQDNETKKNDLSVILASLTPLQRMELRNKLLNKNQSDDHIAFISNIFSLAEKIEAIKTTKKISLFKAIFILEHREFTPLISSYQDHDSDFLTKYKKQLISESKKYRDKFLIEPNQDMKKKFREMEEKALKQLTYLYSDYKRIANHKIMKRKMLEIAPVVVSNTKLPYSIKLIASRIHIQSNSYNQTNLLNEMEKYYQIPELKHIFDMAAHAVMTRPKFSIIFLSEKNTLNYRKYRDSIYSIGGYNLKNSIHIAEADKFSAGNISNLIHELTHYVMNELYQNSSLPFKKNQSTKEIEYAMRETLKLMYTKLHLTMDDTKTTYMLGKDAWKAICGNNNLNDLDLEILEYILGAYGDSYTEVNEYAEIVARCYELLAFLFSINRLGDRFQYFKPLITYNRDVTAKAISDFLQIQQNNSEFIRNALNLIRQLINENNIKIFYDTRNFFGVHFPVTISFNNLSHYQDLLANDYGLNVVIETNSFNTLFKPPTLKINHSAKEIIEKLYKDQVTLQPKLSP